MRIAAVSLSLLSIILTALTMRAMNESRRWMADANDAVMSYALAERALQVDLLKARVGLLRNYDPVNADLASARNNLATLQALPLSEQARAILARILVKNEQHEQLVEQFKSGNALLQNSLSRFTASGSADGGKHALLSARILKLTLDTSPQTVRDAQKALEQLEQMQSATEGTAAAQLTAHARLLVSTLPQIDELLHAIRAMDMERRVDVLRLALQDEADARSANVRHLEIALGVALALFLATATALLIFQRLRTQELKAQAANERLSAAIAIPLIDTGHENFVSRVHEAVRHLALHIGARRLQLVTPGIPICQQFSWPDSRVGPDWLRKLVAAADADDAWVEDRVIASQTAERVRGALGQAMLELKVMDLVLLRTVEPFRVVIGFEPQGLATAQRRDHLAGVSSAIVAIAHGARREVLQLERERLERTLARVRRMETIGAMASGVAHNFNNIICAIGGFAEMGQERTRGGSSARSNFDEIQGAVERARDLVDDILNFAKQGQAIKRPINLVDVLDQAVRLLSASSRGEAMFHLTTSQKSYPVLGAGSDLQQVFLNICNNASHASAGRPVEICMREIWLFGERQMSHGGLYPGKYVAVSISDTGPGIPDAAIRRLFEPFFTTKAGGTGLGLSTAWEIIQDHGGTIDVENIPEGGARFSVWLPELVADASVSTIGNGAVILLLAEPERLSADEELLAELGYEPLGYSIYTQGDVLCEAMADADAVLIATSSTDAAEEALRAVRLLSGARAVIVATPEGEAISRPGYALTYPFQARELSEILSGLTAAALAQAS